MKRWRIAMHHPEDRYEPDDDVADAIREKIKEAQSKADIPGMWSTLRALRIELAKRLYGE